MATKLNVRECHISFFGERKIKLSTEGMFNKSFEKVSGNMLLNILDGSKIFLDDEAVKRVINKHYKNNNSEFIRYLKEELHMVYPAAMKKQEELKTKKAAEAKAKEDAKKISAQKAVTGNEQRPKSGG
jgi:hypothetical protein